MTASASPEHVVGNCCLCEHSARLHVSDGCIASRCTCRLTDTQVKFVEHLQTERLPVDFAFRTTGLLER